MVNGPPTNIMYMKMESKQVEQAEQAVPSKANSAEHLDARAMRVIVFADEWNGHRWKKTKTFWQICIDDYPLCGVDLKGKLSPEGKERERQKHYQKFSHLLQADFFSLSILY